MPIDLSSVCSLAEVYPFPLLSFYFPFSSRLIENTLCDHNTHAKTEPGNGNLREPVVKGGTKWWEFWPSGQDN